MVRGYDSPLDEVQLEVLQRRYLSRDSKTGEVLETPDEMWDRIARAIAEAELHEGPEEDRVAKREAWEEIFRRLLGTQTFLPNTPCIINAGREIGMLSACFVLPVEDSIGEIFKTAKDMALVQKGGGGTGFAFTHLRPKDSIVSTTGHKASGPVSFMKVYDAATSALKQGGVRRGANMGILRVDHPDIEEFITCKNIEGDISNFNISVGITDDFMDAVENGDSFRLTFGGKVYKTVDARALFNKIVKNAWLNGEPGVVFLDTMDRHNHCYAKRGPIEATNPCAEQPLHPYDSCTLGSINISKFVMVDGGIVMFDEESFKECVKQCVRFLDNVVTVNKYPLPEIEEVTKDSRRIGLGMMGLADALREMGMHYDSDEGRDFAESIMRILHETAESYSEDLAVERGEFPIWDEEFPIRQRRNMNLTTIAPTGSIALIAGCSQGIEPYFASKVTHKVLDTELVRQVPGKRSNYKIASEIDWRDHVRMQAAIQKSNDSGVSKTINMDNSATEQDIKDAYMMAYKLGCKGITIYRDGSREVQVLNTGDITKHAPEPECRPDTLQGKMPRIPTGIGKLIIAIGETEEGQPFETVLTLAKSGRVSQSLVDAIGRLSSLWLRSGGHPKYIVKSLKGISGGDIRFHKGMTVLSVPDGFAKVLEREYLTAEEKEETKDKVVDTERLSQEEQVEMELIDSDVCLFCE